MDCSKVQSMIEPFLKNELNDADKDSFISHIRTCKACHEELEVYHVIYSVVDQLDNDNEDENIDYMATLEQKLARTETRVKRRKLYRQIGFSAILVAVLAVVCLILLFLI